MRRRGLFMALNSRWDSFMMLLWLWWLANYITFLTFCKY